eukprot:SAG22_NODE_400_length_11089_cov_6.934668_8_plen_357_part_00
MAPLLRLLALRLLPLLLAASRQAAGAAVDPAPSFLFILGDDIGWADFSYNNGTAASPHVKAWTEAPGTVVMQDFHSGGTVCSPTRATVLTGRNHFRDCVDYVYGCSDMTECVPGFNFAPQKTFTVPMACRDSNKNYKSWFGEPTVLPPSPLPFCSCASQPPPCRSFRRQVAPRQLLQRQRAIRRPDVQPDHARLRPHERDGRGGADGDDELRMQRGPLSRPCTDCASVLRVLRVRLMRHAVSHCRKPALRCAACCCCVSLLGHRRASGLQEWYEQCDFGHDGGPTHCGGKGNPGGGPPLKSGCCFNYVRIPCLFFCCCCCPALLLSPSSTNLSSALLLVAPPCVCSGGTTPTPPTA